MLLCIVIEIYRKTHQGKIVLCICRVHKRLSLLFLLQLLILAFSSLPCSSNHMCLRYGKDMHVPCNRCLETGQLGTQCFVFCFFFYINRGQTVSSSLCKDGHTLINIWLVQQPPNWLEKKKNAHSQLKAQLTQGYFLLTAGE